MNSINSEDNLNLKIFSFDKDIINTNENIIRNVKDENGRLMKLLQEKEFEIKKLKRDSEKTSAVKDLNMGDISAMNDGAASIKIIELSKK